jgi:hypothetical protein
VRNATYAETGRATALDAVAGSNRVSRVFVPATNRVAVGCESASNRAGLAIRVAILKWKGAEAQRPEGGVAAGFIGGDALYGFFDFGVPLSLVTHPMCLRGSAPCLRDNTG